MGLLFSDPGVRGGAPNRLLRLFPSATPFHPPLRSFFPYSRGCRGVVKKKQRERGGARLSLSLSHRVAGDVPERDPRRGPRRPRPALSCERRAFRVGEGGWELRVGGRISRLGVRGASRGRRRDPCRPSRGPWRRGLSKSVAKAPIAPESRRRIVDIPRFLSRPIPVWGAFATDLDTPPTRTATGVPPAPSRASQAAHNGVLPVRRPTRAIMTLLVSPGTFLVRKAQRELR